MTKYNSSDSLHIAKKISKHDLSNFYKFSLPKMKSKIHEKYNPLNCINHFSLPKVRQILKRALTNSNGVERIVLKNKVRFVRSFDRSIDRWLSKLRHRAPLDPRLCDSLTSQPRIHWASLSPVPHTRLWKPTPPSCRS